MNLTNGIDLSIFINDQELPLDYFACPSIQIDGSDEMGIPIMIMQLIDNTGGGLLKKINPLPDGALIAVKIDSGDQSVTREFRVTASNVDGPSMLIRAYLNHPHYVVTTERAIYHSTAKDALARICKTCGLVLDCPVTSDLMRWQPVNQRLINFARYILNGAYISDESMIAGRVRLDGIMKIRDLTNLGTSIGLFGFAPGAVPAYGFMPTSGANENLHGGYKQEFAMPDMFGVYDTINSMDMTLTETSLNRNPKIADLANFGAVKYGEFGHKQNYHAKYHRAIYNNNRMEKLFTMRSMLALNNAITNIDGMDVITLDNKTTTDGTVNGETATSYDGDWIVSSKSIYVENNQYFERFSLMRSGLNIDMHSKTI